MELKTLFLGMFISMAAFSVKAGVGWAYLWSKCPRGRKIAASMAVLATYAVLFAGVTLLVSKVNILAHYEIFAPLWQGGVTIHWLAAIFIFIWGLILLKSPTSCHKDGEASKAWMALVIPCPVCMSVVLVSASCLALYFPNDAPLAMTCLYLAFTALAAISGLVVLAGTTFRSENSESAEIALGQAMILIAAYFIISALVMPQFAEISKIYRLSVYSGERQTSDPMTKWLVFGVISLLLAFGFSFAGWRIKISKKSKNFF
jgi:predicted transporter